MHTRGDSINIAKVRLMNVIKLKKMVGPAVPNPRLCRTTSACLYPLWPRFLVSEVEIVHGCKLYKFLTYKLT